MKRYVVVPGSVKDVLPVMPRWKCHKVVRASKIIVIVDDGITSDGRLYLKCHGEFGYFSRSSEWMRKHDPKVGGYLVEYEDGYLSYSPAEAFEGGYERIGEGG